MERSLLVESLSKDRNHAQKTTEAKIKERNKIAPCLE